MWGLSPASLFHLWSLAVFSALFTAWTFSIRAFCCQNFGGARARERVGKFCAPRSSIFHLSQHPSLCHQALSSWRTTAPPPAAHNFFPLFVRPLHMTSSFLRAYTDLAYIIPARRNSSASAARTRKFHQPNIIIQLLWLSVDVAFGNLYTEERV